MNKTIKDWQSLGEYIAFGPLQHKVYLRDIGVKNATPDRTLMLLHGFPESSYSFHKVITGLAQRFDRIVLFDMIGYGLSDKPKKDYSYSLLEQADLALNVWHYFGIEGGHLLAHDMGTSVACELLFRSEHNLLPAWFHNGFQSITFTNGSIVMAFSKLRIAQKILLSRFGASFSRLISYPIFAHQVRSAQGNDRLMESDLQLLWAFNALQDGHRKSYLTIKYIQDRYRFEHCRWLPALQQSKLPINFCWGDQDQVAQIAMAQHLSSTICPQARLEIMPGLGHFGQLGSPNDWVSHILKCY